jgi:NitT/TauT family transport system substrate-binding protein
MEWIPMQKKKKWLLLAVVCMTVAMLTACGSSNKENVSPSVSNASTSVAPSEETLSFKMGVEPWVGYGPWWIAAEKGIFKKYGLDVTVINFNQDSDINAAFASDNIKVANIATHTAIKMVGNNGLALNGIVLLDESHKADAILAPSSIKSIADLRGKKVAFEEGTTSDLLLRNALKENNMTIDDITVVYMPASDAGLALLSKKVDAAVTYEPYISTVKAKGDVQILYSGENAPGLISDISVIKSDYLSAHPDVKEKLKKVWDETLTYWKDNTEEGNKILAEKSGIALADMPVILEGLKYFNSDDQAKLAESGNFHKTASDIQDILTNQKVLDKQVDIQEMFQLK